MSIINDALKKAQNSLDGNKSQSSDTPTENNTFIRKNLKHINESKKQAIQEHQERNQQKPSPQAATEEYTLKSRSTRPQARKNPSPLAGIVVILFTVIIVGAGAFYLLNKSDLVPTTELKKLSQMLPLDLAQTSSSSSSQPSRPSPLPQPRRNSRGRMIQNSLMLNGIVVMSDKTVALINNEIYEVGDIVDGKQIISISEDEVQLKDHRGEIITLENMNKKL